MRLRAPWWFKAICLVPLLCCCTRTKEVHEQENVEQQATVQTATEKQFDETLQRGPETITTTTEEYEDADPSAVVRGGESDGGFAAVPVLPVHSQQLVGVAQPVLIKRTVVVDQRGAVTDTKTAEAKGASTAAFAATDDKKIDEKTVTKSGPSFLFFLALGSGLTIALGVCWKLGLLAKAWGSL